MFLFIVLAPGRLGRNTFSLINIIKLLIATQYRMLVELRLSMLSAYFIHIHIINISIQKLLHFRRNQKHIRSVIATRQQHLPACARPSSPRCGRGWRRFAGRNISCRAESCPRIHYRTTSLCVPRGNGGLGPSPGYTASDWSPSLQRSKDSKIQNG